jgi:hypothetical protein
MKSVRSLVTLMFAVPFTAFCAAHGQTPVITGIHVSNGCSSSPCPVGPGMTVILTGQNFGTAAGGVALCDCPFATTVRWAPTRIQVTVDEVTPDSTISLETPGGVWSNTLPYMALAPVITRIDVGDCSYVPNESRKLCVINPGAQVTIHGSYFGRYAGQVGTCDCADATIDSWNPNWVTNPTTGNNTIVVTPVDELCGSSIVVQAGGMWSNPVPYTTCAN